MPGVLFWNVQHFSADKFFLRNRTRALDGDQNWEPSAKRRKLNVAQRFRDVLVAALTNNPPDFIVIVEVQAGFMANEGTAVNDNGAYRLLRVIRTTTGQNAWKLVPPICQQTGESVAVFYRSDRYQFTGPWRHLANGAAAAAGVAATYAAPWTRTLPARAVAGNSPYNPGQRENRLAAKTGGYQINGVAVPNFGQANARQPYSTTFWDNVNNQTIRLVAFHAPPSQISYDGNPVNSPSTQGTRALSQIDDLYIAGEKVIVVGDFNVSLFNPNTTQAAYGHMLQNGFTQVFAPGVNFNPTYPSRGYLTTHIKVVARATPVLTNGYPAFGYGSDDTSDFGGVFDSIDNAFVRGGVPQNATIVNVITGSPYTAVAVPAGCPPGHFAYASLLGDATTLNSPVGYPNDDNLPDRSAGFRDVDNYALVYGASDHMALRFDC